MGVTNSVPEHLTEPEALRRWLDDLRGTVERKVAGLTAEQLATRAVPPSSLSILGLLRHLAQMEHFWFVKTLSHRDEPQLYVPNGDWDARVPRRRRHFRVRRRRARDLALGARTRRRRDGPPRAFRPRVRLGPCGPGRLGARRADPSRLRVRGVTAATSICSAKRSTARPDSRGRVTTVMPAAPRHPTGGSCQAASSRRCPQAVCSS